MLSLTIVDEQLNKKWWELWKRNYKKVYLNNLDVEIIIRGEDDPGAINYFDGCELSNAVSFKLFDNYCKFYGINFKNEVLTYISEKLNKFDEINLIEFAKKFKNIKLITNRENGIKNKLFEEYGIVIEETNECTGIIFPQKFKIHCSKINLNLPEELLVKLYEMLFFKNILKIEDFEFSLLRRSAS